MQFALGSTPFLVLVAATSLAGVACNAVFGLEELRNAEHVVDPKTDGGTSDGPAEGATSGADGGVCHGGDLRCSASGVPQKCNAQGTAFEDQAACPSEKPDCDPATGLCQPRCESGSKRCGGSAIVQQCDLQGVWRDTLSCPFACTGTTDAVACGGTCKPGTHTCGANNTPLLCDETGTNQMQTACATACTGNGECTGECTPNATRCPASAANGVETCDAAGQWGKAMACTFVCDAATKICGGECIPGTADRCAGSTVQSCDATGHWKDKTPCGATPCTLGQCRACTANEKQCNADKPQTCGATGAWTDDQASACPFVCDAPTGKCAGECVPGAEVCTGTSTKHCGANGLYGAATVCTNICDTATGKCGGVCIPTAHRCSGTTAQTCGVNGQWGSDMPCQYGCAAATGLCNTCTDEAMATTCSGGKCGPTVNNCGHTVQCSTPCAGTGQSCGGAGVTGVCGCTPQASTQTCQNGAKCGNVLNNCGQSVACATCTAPQTCGGGGTPNVCGLGCTNSCTQGQKICVSGQLATCTLGANGCWAPGAGAACASHQSCTGNPGSAVCTCNADPVCSALGQVCASGSQLATCSSDGQGCFYQSSLTACTNGACSGGACCTNMCTNGASQCLTTASTQIQSCSVGGNGCTTWSTSSCPASTVCERSGAASCGSPFWAEWPMPNDQTDVTDGAFNRASYTDNGNGTVTDNVTGLLWQQTSNFSASQTQGVTYCEQLSLAGYTGWRLPTLIELLSLVQIDKSFIDGTAFPGGGGEYMSSTLVAGTPTRAWYVLFQAASTQTDDTTALDFQIRCVR